MANEGVLAALEKEFRPLLAPKLLAEAKAAQVVWARVKGYPAWPAQVLTEAAALRRKDLGQERHSKGNSVPVMFFGTVEVAWVKDADVVDFKEGLYQGFFDRKTKHFRLALEQVCDYLALDRKRKAPPKWWCRPPSNGLDDHSDGPSPKLVSAAGSGAAKGGGQRQDASKSSRQRADASESDMETSIGEDEAPAAQANRKKAAVKAANGKDGAGGKQLQVVVATAPVVKPRDSSTGRLPRENGSTAASTNTATHTQAKKPPAAPGRQQALLKDVAPVVELTRGTAKEGRHVAAVATSEAKVPLVSQFSQQQQRLRSSAGTSVASARGNDAGLQPRKRLKVDAAAGAVYEPKVGSASSLPPPPSPAAKGTTTADEPNAVDTAGISEAAVLKLPAEIRRLAGIRLPAIPKKPCVKVEESPRENPAVKAEHITASTVPNGSAMASKPVLPAGEGVGMELRSARLRQASGAVLEGQPDVGCFSGASERKRSHSEVNSSGKESSEDSDDDEEAEEDQNSEEADSDPAASSSSDEDSDVSEEESEDDAVVPGARRSSRVAVTAQLHGQATRVKVQSQQPSTRGLKGEPQRQLSRLVGRRTSSRLGFKVPEVASLKKASRNIFPNTDSDDENGEAGDDSDDDSEAGGEVEDEQSSSAATSSGGTESASEKEPAVKESGGSEDGGRRPRQHTRALQVNRPRPQRTQAARKVGASPVSQQPSREASQPADQHAKTSPAREESDIEATDDDKKSQQREGSGTVNGLAARAIPLELRRLQNSPSAGPPAVDTNGPRTLRDRSSSARRAITSTGVTPTQTAIAGASAGGKRGDKCASEDGSGVSMYIAVEESRSPEHHRDRDGQKAGPVQEGNIAPQAARSEAIDGRCSKAGSAANSASPPPAPVPGSVPVRKKPPSLGVPSTARSGVDVGARQLPAITPARAVLRSLASSADAVPSSTLPASRCTGATSVDALLAPVAVRVLKKPSTGPPTRRLMEPGLEMSISPTDLPEATSLDCKANTKLISSAEVAVTELLPQAVSIGRTDLWKSEEGQADDQKIDPAAEQQQVQLPSHQHFRQALAQKDCVVDVQDATMTEVTPCCEDTQRGIIDRMMFRMEVEQVNVVFTKQPQQEFTQFGAQETAVLCIQPALELELGRGGTAEQQDQLNPQPSSCCEQASMTAFTEPVEHAPALPSRSSVVANQDNELANRSPVHALSAPLQLQHVVVEQAASALDLQARSSPRSLIHDEALISEEQLPDHGEAMAEHDGHQVFQAERLVPEACGIGSDAPFAMQVNVPASEAVPEVPSMPSPPPAAPVTPPEGHVASASGAVSAPPPCADSRASSEAEFGAGAPAGVSGASCSAPLWGEDDEAAACARARELEELGEVAAALAGLHQAEVPRFPPVRLVTQPLASQLPNALRVDPLVERMWTRDSRGLSRSAESRDSLFAHESVLVEGFRWPQPEPHLPSQDQPFALPHEWLVTRPPRYEPVKRNVWLSRNKPKRLPKDEISICACRAPPFAALGELQRMGCGPNCLNRLSSILCDAKLCPCGELCSNRSLHLLRQPKTEVFLTENRGWGVRTMEPLSKGAFIIEYAGEVIDERELGRRMEHARMNGEPHFYIMELSAGLYIDARRKGNIARLINSSCDPNCETQKWHDASTGEVRVGIFTSRDIAPGEELVYDYFFYTYGALKPSAASFVCMCGSKNCRGTMDLHPEKRRDLGRRVEVFWDGDGQYYRAVIVAYHPTSKKHTVMYEDGGTEKLSLDEVPHRWLDDDHQRTSAQKSNTVRGNGDSVVQSVVGEARHQQTPVAATTVDVDLADVLPVPDRGPCSIVAVPSQAPPRPLIPIDQRCLLLQLGSSSMDATADQSNGQSNKHELSRSEIHLPLKKRPRMLQPMSVLGQELSGSQLSPMSAPLGTSDRAEEVYITGQPQGSGGSAGCVVGRMSAHNRLSGGGEDSTGGDPNGLSGRASLRRESSNTGSGRISSVTAEEDDPNEDLDSLLEAAEAVAALRTAPISNPPALYALQDTGLPPQPRHIRSGSVTAGIGSVAMLQTAKVASPRHMAAVQRAGPPNGLPPHGGSRPSCAATTLPSSSSSGFISYQAGGVRQHRTNYGSTQQGESRGVVGLSEHCHRPSQTRNGRFSGDREGSAGPVAGSRGRIGNGYGDSYCNGHGTKASCEINREDLLWKLVGIEKPKNLLPLFSGGREEMRNGDAGSKLGDTWIAPSHPYGSLLRALEASELLPHADQLRLLSQQHAQQQGHQETEQQAPLRAPQQQASPLQQHTFHHHQQHTQQQRTQQHQTQVLAQPQPTQLARSSGTLPHQPQATAAGSASSSEALALSAWHQLAQQHAPNGSSYGTHGQEGSSLTAFLHTAQQQQAVAAATATNSAAAPASAAVTAAGQLHLHPLQSHGSYKALPMTATGPGGAAGASGLPNHIANQQQFGASMAAAATHWQPPLHSQPGSIMQDLVQLYVAQHAVGSHPMLAMAGTTAVGVSRV